MATRDEAHGKRCASVRLPALASTPVSKARKAKARPIPKLGRHSSGQARVTLNGKVHYCGRWGTAEAVASDIWDRTAWRCSRGCGRPYLPTRATVATETNP